MSEEQETEIPIKPIMGDRFTDLLAFLFWIVKEFLPVLPGLQVTFCSEALMWLVVYKMLVTI